MRTSNRTSTWASRSIRICLGLVLGGIALYASTGGEGFKIASSIKTALSSGTSASPTITIHDVLERFPLCGIGISDCGSYQDSKDIDPYPPSALSADKKTIVGNKIKTELTGPEGRYLNFELIWNGGHHAIVEVLEYAKFHSYRVKSCYHLTWSQTKNDWQVTGSELLWINDSSEQGRIGQLKTFDTLIKFLKN
jgi:hypothetical protein